MSNKKHDSQIITIPNAQNLGIHMVFVKDNQIHINLSYEETDLKIEEMDLSYRALQALQIQGITTLSQLLEKSMFDLMQGNRFGGKTINEIETALSEKNLSLKKKFPGNIIPGTMKLAELFKREHGFKKTIAHLESLGVTTLETFKKLTANANNEVISNQMVSKFEAKLVELALM